jgi:hypothetical protein
MPVKRLSRKEADEYGEPRGPSALFCAAGDNTCSVQRSFNFAPTHPVHGI